MTRVSETVEIAVELESSTAVRIYEAHLTYSDQDGPTIGWDCHLEYQGNEVWVAMNWLDRQELLDTARRRARSHARRVNV